MPDDATEPMRREPDSHRARSDRPDLSVIVPTYCEAENLPLLIPALSTCLREADLAAEIIIVDDDSPDDTAAVVEELARAHPVQLLIRRGERGLSTAVLHGFAHAQGGVLACMDADGSHPPETLPEMVQAIRDGRASFVIGSRYVHGGGTHEDWGLLRALTSRVATLCSRPLTRVRDPMSGYLVTSIWTASLPSTAFI